MFDMKEWCKSLSNAIMTNYCDFKNISGQDLEELYKWIDIKKDIAEAEYYEAAKMKELSIVEAMEKESEEGFAGYNNRRYSSGRYAPAGRGHYSGYRPYYGDDRDWVMGYGNVYDGGMYPVEGRYTSSEGTYGMSPAGESSVRSGYTRRGNGRYGMSYDRYNEVRRHYTDHKDLESKKKMNDAASMVVNDMIDIMQDIWADLDDEEKMKHTQAIVEATKKY